MDATLDPSQMVPRLLFGLIAPALYVRARVIGNPFVERAASGTKS